LTTGEVSTAEFGNVALPEGWTTTNTVHIFRQNNGYEYYGAKRLKSYKMWRDGELLCSLVPVRLGAEGCLYDEVNFRVLRNLGTDKLLIGEDLV
jgi:hypothetical protein